MSAPEIFATVRTMGAAIGRFGAISCGALAVYVRVVDAKQSYGSVRLLVTPLSGRGEIWVNADRCVLLDDATPPARVTL